MPTKTFAVTAALLSALASAANVNVHNKCQFDVKATPSHEGADDAALTITAGQSHSWPADGEAWCLKLYSPGASNPTQLEWSTWGANVLSYDLSNIDMHSDMAFLRYGMSLTSQDPSCKGQTAQEQCRPALCPPTNDPSNTPCQDAYNQPFDPRTLGASASYDIDMVLCTEQSGSGGNAPGPVAAPAPAPQQPSAQPAAPQPAKPATTLATSVAPSSPSVYAAAAVGGHPVQIDAQGKAYEGPVVTSWVANTQVVTQYVTANAKRAEETAVAEPIRRRHVHHHGHHHDE